MSTVKITVKEEAPSLVTLFDLPRPTPPRFKLERPASGPRFGGALAAYLDHEISPSDATPQLLWACMLTGWVSIVTWEASLIWCGAQTSVGDLI